MEASEQGNDDVVMLLTQLKEDILYFNETNAEKLNRTALTLAVRKGQVGSVKKLLSCSKVDVTLKDSGGYTAFCHAIKRYGEVNLELILRNDHQRVEIVTQSYKRIVELFITKDGSQLYLQENWGRSPLIVRG